MKDNEVLQASSFMWKSSQGKAISSRGASGGIYTLWNFHLFEIEDWESESNWILVSLRHQPTGKLFSIINIYMPSINRDKDMCWNSLFSLQNRIRPSLFIFVGDFNTTLHSCEKRDSSIVKEATRENMEDLLTIFYLFDTKPALGRFTWSNKRHEPRHIVAGLDRFLISSSILEENFDPSSKILPWVGSDH